MRTAIISDLHLSSLSGADLLRDGEIQEALLTELEGAERLVLLGDAIELRERPLGEAIGLVGPILARIGEAMSGRPVMLIPGNHDHQLAEPLLEGFALGRPRELGLEHAVRPRGPGKAIVDALAPAKVEIRYPGIWLADGIYATHGHYLDCHLRLPRPEALAIGASMRLTGGLPASAGPADYEQALRPIYGLLDGVAGTGVFKRLAGPQHPSLQMWQRINRGRNSGPMSDRLIARAAFPAAVRTLSRLLRIDFEPDLTPGAVARLGLEAMRTTAERLDIGADDVLFSHTHNAGPAAGDEARWSIRNGVRLHNTGSWCFSRAVCATAEGAPLFWPGTVTWLEDGGGLRRVGLLDDRSFDDLVAAAKRIARSGSAAASGPLPM
jgi:hypothetical protein